MYNQHMAVQSFGDPLGHEISLRQLTIAQREADARAKMATVFKAVGRSLEARGVEERVEPFIQQMMDKQDKAMEILKAMPALPYPGPETLNGRS